MDLESLRELIDANPVKGSPEEMRAAFRALTEPVRAAVPAGETIEIAGLKAELHAAFGGQPILYLHGGGYVFGGPDTHRGLAHSLMHAARQDVLVLDLPKAPEHPWPAQKQAAAAAVHALVEEFGQFVTLVGDSAGAHLALLTALETQMVRRCVAFSPNTVRDHPETESRTSCEESDLMNDDESDRDLAAKVFGTLDGDDPDQSLIERDLRTLPLTFIKVGTDEILRDDSLVFARKAIRDGAEIRLSARPGFHLEELFAPLYAPGLWSVQEAGDWIRASS